MAEFDDQTDQSTVNRLVRGGVLLIAGLVMLFFAWGYPTGTINQMGPGFIPQTVGVLISVLAVAIIVIDLRNPEQEDVGQMHWRGLIFISAAIAIFAILVDVAGLVPSMFLAVAVSICADDDARPIPTLIYASIATLFGWLLFLVALGLPIPAFWR
ncbi:tripartite tricarboxylate transporter TctB family protein [uncultured Pelagimonas sp.]|uniref:tripartite tricarboxylate transporter TctB family protein n=1 Tax=uncultured Pelagimonas sp. TaxID=1618102 RepID=UPI0026299B9F|nr:tripartite tricarboxylate transporter TctB family protein [uncultured Pelagimonas sp.]